MRADFSLPGYEIESFLGAGAAGESWLARARIGGDQVVLKRVPVAGGDGRERLAELVGALCELSHPHLLPVRDLQFRGRGVFLVLPYAAGGSLGQLLLARERLDPGEVITTTAPLAEALAALHGRGIVHGDVTPENVLFTRGGLPLLADPGLLDPGLAGGTAADVYALAAVAAVALTGSLPPSQPTVPAETPPEVARAIRAGLRPRPHDRPAAGELADLLYRAGPAAPVRFPMGLVLTEAGLADAGVAVAGVPDARVAVAGPAAVDGLDEGDRAAVDDLDEGDRGAVDDLDEGDRGRRRAVVGIAVALPVLAAAAILGGWYWQGADDPAGPARLAGATPTAASTATPTAASTATPTAASTATPTATPGGRWTPEQARWLAVLRELDTRRGEAFARTDPDLLGRVYVPDSPALQQDRRQLDKCVDHGCHLTGVRFDVRGIDIIDTAARRTVLRVTDRLEPYEIVFDDGRQLSRRGGPLTSRVLTLVRGPGGTWRMSSIHRAGATSPAPR